MVRDGYYYAGGFLLAAILVSWLASPWLAIPCVLLGWFFLWFFRDPDRTVPSTPGAIVSPADGKVTQVAECTVDGSSAVRISIFLNVFDVHVNRSPITGVIRSVRYQKGRFGNAMDPACSDQNEQNIVSVEGEGHTVVFKQIAGLLARRIVFTKQVGDPVERGERVGLIKFGSRVDVILEPGAVPQTKLGDRVKGGESVLAQRAESGRILVDSAAHEVGRWKKN
jgi:phosphatidylserine decarboxylase